MSSLDRTIKQYGGTTAKKEHICRHYRVLYAACSEHSPDTLRCVCTNRRIRFEYAMWTGKLLNPERKSCGFKNTRMQTNHFRTLQTAHTQEKISDELSEDMIGLSWNKRRVQGYETQSNHSVTFESFIFKIDFSEKDVCYIISLQNIAKNC